MSDRSWSLPLQEMARLPFVQWDRFAGDAESYTVYGWIPRDDGRSDFVVLIDTGSGFGFLTSSAEWSERISIRLFGKAGNHQPCKRVEDHCDLPNVVRLSPPGVHPNFSSEGEGNRALGNCAPPRIKGKKVP